VNDFVDSILAGDPNANVVLLGDLNDFEFSDTVDILEGGVLHDLMDTLPLPERYSYEFEGNAQVLDHILFSGSLFAPPFVFDPVHVNADFFHQASDHDPSVVRVALNEAPRVDAGGPYSVAEGGSVGLAATGNDAEGGTLAYAWDLDDNGTYEMAGQTPTFSAATLDAPSTRTVGVQVTDDVGQTGTDTAAITITNVAPTATFNAPATVFDRLPVLAHADQSPGSVHRRHGNRVFLRVRLRRRVRLRLSGSSSSASCPTTDVGTRSVRGKIQDKDGGATTYTGTVQVIVTFDSLCVLTRSYARRAADADALCEKLALAAAGDKDMWLKAYRNQVDAKTGSGSGKSFTAEQGALLKLLSTRL
jgi:PKD domain